MSTVPPQCVLCGPPIMSLSHQNYNLNKAQMFFVKGGCMRRLMLALWKLRSQYVATKSMCANMDTLQKSTPPLSLCIGTALDAFFAKLRCFIVVIMLAVARMLNTSAVKYCQSLFARCGSGLNATSPTQPSWALVHTRHDSTPVAPSAQYSNMSSRLASYCFLGCLQLHY